MQRPQPPCITHRTECTLQCTSCASTAPAHVACCMCMLHLHVARCVLHDVCCTMCVARCMPVCCMLHVAPWQVRFYRPGKDGVQAFAVPSEQVSCLSVVLTALSVPQRHFQYPLRIISTLAAFSVPFTHYQYLSSIFSTLYALSVPKRHFQYPLRIISTLAALSVPFTSERASLLRGRGQR
jgi:hypothetical protein